MAGAYGNFIDRLRLGYVIDFFYFKLIDFPVFNVARYLRDCIYHCILSVIVFYYKEETLNESFVVENEEGMRLDRYLAEEYEELSRSRIQKLVKDGLIKVNTKPVKASYRLLLGDRVEITVPEAKEPDIVPEDIPLDILYEDQDVIVVNKPEADGCSSGSRAL